MLFPTLALALVSSIAQGGSAPTQEAQPAVLIRAQEVYARPGQILKDTSILIQNGRIVAIGQDLEVPEGGRTIEGKVVCAGYIDPWSQLGIDSSSARDLTTTASTPTVDAVDRFGQIYWREAARDAGVLLVRSQAGSQAYIGGVGAVLFAAPGGGVVLEDACLQFTSGKGRPGAGDLIGRVVETDHIAALLLGGLSYREKFNEYRYELEEWQKKIAEEEVKLEKDFKKAKKSRDKGLEKAKEKEKDFKEKKYKEDKQPKKPRFDADKEVLARAANGELPVVVSVNGGPEVRALLETTAQFGRLRLVLSGAEGVLPFAKQLAERQIPVILTPARESGRGEDSANLAGALAGEGVRVLIGTGGGVASVRDLAVLAQRAMGAGLSAEQALASVTLGAAEAFDLADRFGSVEVGKLAELLVLDGPPLIGKPTVILTGGDVIEL